LCRRIEADATAIHRIDSRFLLPAVIQGKANFLLAGDGRHFDLRELVYCKKLLIY